MSWYNTRDLSGLGALGAVALPDIGDHRQGPSRCPATTPAAGAPADVRDFRRLEWPSPLRTSTRPAHRRPFPSARQETAFRCLNLQLSSRRVQAGSRHTGSADEADAQRGASGAGPAVAAPPRGVRRSCTALAGGSGERGGGPPPRLCARVASSALLLCRPGLAGIRTRCRAVCAIVVQGRGRLPVARSAPPACEAQRGSGLWPLRV